MFVKDTEQGKHRYTDTYVVVLIAAEPFNILSEAVRLLLPTTHLSELYSKWAV
jgi:hypothetical protein